MNSGLQIPNEYWEKERTCFKDCSESFNTCTNLCDEIITKKNYAGWDGESNKSCFIPKPEKPDLSNQEHYTKGSIQPWDYIIANDLDFLEGNVVKYITRHKYKGTQKADLEKIKVCVDKITEGLES